MRYKMVKGDPTTIFTVVLTKRAVAVITPKQVVGESPCHRVQLLAITPYEKMMVTVILGEYPKGILFLYI